MKQRVQLEWGWLELKDGRKAIGRLRECSVARAGFIGVTSVVHNREELFAATQVAAIKPLTEDQVRHLCRADQDIEGIKQVVAAYFGLTTVDLERHTRRPRIAYPRMLVMLLGREMGFTLEEIGSCLGGLDHTTIKHGANRIKDLASIEPEFRAALDHLRKHFGISAI